MIILFPWFQINKNKIATETNDSAALPIKKLNTNNITIKNDIRCLRLFFNNAFIKQLNSCLQSTLAIHVAAIIKRNSAG